MMAVSTCYWTSGTKYPDKIVDEILDMGFEAIELEYRISESQFKRIRSRIKRELKVLSVHNYFPKPDEPHIKGSGDLFLLSSTDRDEHATAIKYTKRTIECANDMEAMAVVLHLGRVEMENPFEELKKLFQEGKIDSEEGVRFVKEQKSLRNRLRQKNFDSVLKALDRLTINAEKYGVFLGIENRFYLHEIPNLEELQIIFREFEGSNIRYWHDIGHAVIQERLGLCSQKDLLKILGNDIIGIHIHDVKGIEDHIAPGEGDFDIGSTIKQIRKDALRVLEVHSKARRENLLMAKDIFD